MPQDKTTSMRTSFIKEQGSFIHISLTLKHRQQSDEAHFNVQLFAFLTDGTIYEVEDQQENYDDIEAGPEVTKAEVHDSPQSTLENREG